MNKLLTSSFLLLTSSFALAAEVAVDFSKPVGKVNAKLHSSGWGPGIASRNIYNADADIGAMGFYAARTHDWALVNSGQHVIDTHLIFPLMHLDAANPTNYIFRQTDDILKLSKNLGLKLFFRLGTSIEHTQKDVHYNSLAPEDPEKYAEVLAGIMRHYLKGWANGYEWGDAFDGWEIWNEPDGIPESWYVPGKDSYQQRLAFCRFFAIVLKRLKSEFPDQQIGGPALCGYNENYFRDLLTACKEQGVAPDFVSWHHYTQDPNVILDATYKMRAFLDGMDLAKTRTIIDEWHYIRSWDGVHGRNSTTAAKRAAFEGPTGIQNIDSAVFNLTVLSRLQTAPLDEAFYYGCGNGTWGYFGAHGTYNKVWHSMKLFGDFVRLCPTRVATTVVTEQPTLSALAGVSADGKTGLLLVTDYRGTLGKISVRVDGADGVKRISAVVLDDAHDCAPLPILYRDHGIELPRADTNSVAFLVTFEL